MKKEFACLEKKIFLIKNWANIKLSHLSDVQNHFLSAYSQLQIRTKTSTRIT